jgi:tetratricopeptide (TPR) repeat protein
VALLSDLGYEHYVGLATFNLSWAYQELGQRERAGALAEENLCRARSIGSEPLEAHALVELALYAREEGQADESLELLRRAVPILRDLGDVQGLLDGLSRFASVRAQARCPELAARLLSGSLALYEHVGLEVPLYQAKRDEVTLGLIHEQLDEAALAEAWARGQALTLDEALALALDTEPDA